MSVFIICLTQATLNLIEKCSSKVVLAAGTGQCLFDCNFFTVI
ncbi:hypothetical protein CCP3SC1AL1_550001 [Gammaproteobacteria bacterium]